MLTLKDIHWQLPGGEEILKGISFSLEPGKLKVITGPNGNSIFLPADGWINYAHHTDVDLKGYYRIGTQTTIDDAYSIVFDEKYYRCSSE